MAFDTPRLPEKNIHAAPISSFGDDGLLFNDISYKRIPARLTSMAIVSGQFQYGFIEQIWDATSGVYSDYANGMQGDGTNIFATEVHNIPVPEVTVPLSPTPAAGTGPFVWLRFKGIVNGLPEYEFNNGYPPVIVLITSATPDPTTGLFTATSQQYDPGSGTWNNITSVLVRDANM